MTMASLSPDDGPDDGHDDGDAKLREAAERSFRLSSEQYANALALEFDLPFEQVVEVVIAHGEAVSTVEGSPHPEERRYFPAGSLPSHPPRSRKSPVAKTTEKVAHEAVSARMLAEGIDGQVVDRVLADLSLTLKSARRSRVVRRSLWMVPLGIVLVLLVVGVIADIVDDRAGGPSVDPAVGSLDVSEPGSG